MNNPPPDMLDLAILDVVYRGKGLARDAGRVVFVPGTLPGERVRVRLTRVHKQYAEAERVAILEAAPERMDPVCPLTGICPGCRYQHAAYPAEVRLKEAQLRNFLQRQCGVDPQACRPAVPSPLPLGYRNKIVLHGWRESGPAPVLGYFAEDNRTVIDIPSCPLAAEPINAQLAALRADPAFRASLRTHQLLTLRYTPCDGVVWWTGKAGPARAELLTEETAVGPLRVPRESFFQVNPAVAARAIERVQALLREGPPPARVIDLYCGVGVFAFAAAQAGAERVIGIDYDEAAVALARQNAAALGLARAEFQAGAAVQGLRRALKNEADATRTTLIVDPPRRGLDAGVTEAIVQARPGQVIYVSCAPDTLARDIVRLRQAGYAVRSSQLLDMFPRTPYFETVTDLGLDR